LQRKTLGIVSGPDIVANFHASDGGFGPASRAFDGAIIWSASLAGYDAAR